MELESTPLPFGLMFFYRAGNQPNPAILLPLYISQLGVSSHEALSRGPG